MHILGVRTIWVLRKAFKTFYSKLLFIILGHYCTAIIIIIIIIIRRSKDSVCEVSVEVCFAMLAVSIFMALVDK